MTERELYIQGLVNRLHLGEPWLTRQECYELLRAPELDDMDKGPVCLAIRNDILKLLPERSVMSTRLKTWNAGPDCWSDRLHNRLHRRKLQIVDAYDAIAKQIEHDISYELWDYTDEEQIIAYETFEELVKELVALMDTRRGRKLIYLYGEIERLRNGRKAVQERLAKKEEKSDAWLAAQILKRRDRLDKEEKIENARLEKYKKQLLQQRAMRGFLQYAQ